MCYWITRTAGAARGKIMIKGILIPAILIIAVIFTSCAKPQNPKEIYQDFFSAEQLNELIAYINQVAAEIEAIERQEQVEFSDKLLDSLSLEATYNCKVSEYLNTEASDLVLAVIDLKVSIAAYQMHRIFNEALVIMNEEDSEDLSTSLDDVKVAHNNLVGVFYQ